MNITRKTIVTGTSAVLVGMGLTAGGYAAGQASQPSPDVLDVSALGAGPACKEIPEPEDPRDVLDGLWPSETTCDKLGAVRGLTLDDQATAQWAVFWAGDAIREAQTEIATIAGDSSLSQDEGRAKVMDVKQGLATRLGRLTYPALGYLDKRRLY